MTETQSDAVKKALAEQQDASRKSREDAAERLSKGKPTPTQEENDRAMLGEHITEHEDDGSGPDSNVQTRQVEARRPSSGYSTRASTSSSPPRPSPKNE